MSVEKIQEIFIESLEEELKAQQDEDFEQKYLELCLREQRPTQLFQQTLNSIMRAEQTPDAIITPQQENVYFQNNDIPSTKDIQSLSLKAQKDTGSSLMTFFFIRRFLDKLSQNKKKIENLNKSMLKLISDKASESQNLLNFATSIKRKELSFVSVQRILTRQLLKKKKMEEIKEQFQKIKKYFFQYFLLCIGHIPQIQPDSTYKMYWEIFTTFARGILVILVPLEISFNPKIIISDDHIFSIQIFLVLQIDYFIKVNTIIYQAGKAVTDRWEIIKYQVSNNMFIDYCFTFILILQFYLPSGNLDLLLILLMTQTRYIFESSNKIDQVSYLTRPQRGRLGLLKFIVTLTYVAHLFSCIWFWFSSIDTQNSWIINKGLQNLIWSSQYLEAFYFAIVTMLTIGYGDNVPQNQIEKIITILFILGACLWFSYSVNFIGGIIDDITQNQVERNRKMRVINKYMRERDIPYALQYKIKEYLIFRWKEDDEVDLEMEQTLLGQLSDELKETLDKQAYRIFIVKCEFLQKYFSSEFREALFKSIKRKIIQPQNTFSIEINGETNLCYLEQGKLLYQHKDSKQRSKINSQINQGQFICVKQFLQQNSEKEYFKAAGYVSLLTLSKTDFLETLKDYPEDFQKYSQLRDEVSLDIESSQIKDAFYCPVCNSSNHLLNQCPQVQLVLNRELVIKRHCYNTNQIRRKFKRKISEKPIMTRAELLYVQECARIFNLDNPQLIINQMKYFNFVEQEQENNVLLEDQVPSVKIFPASDEYLMISQQKAIKCIDPEIQSDARISPNIRQTNRFFKPIHKMGSLYDHKLLRQNSKSPSYKYHLNEPSIETNEAQIGNIELEAHRKSITDFDCMISENIRTIYKKILYNHEDLAQNRQFKDITFLYLKQNNQTEQDLDQLCNYDFYYPQYNITKIVDQVNKNKQFWQQSILQKYSKYMLYPFQFILKFLKFKRQKSYVSIINKFESIQRARHKMMFLRVNKPSFKRNKVLPEVQVQVRVPSKMRTTKLVIKK